MKNTMICQGCWEQMHVPIFIRGPLSLFYRPFGIKRSQIHPNLCTICESNFTKVKKQNRISITTTILFADLRGYTNLSQTIESEVMNLILHRFYDQCSEAIWESDGIVNKFIGDAVFAIFNFPLVREKHINNAVKAARNIQIACRSLKADVGLHNENEVGVGIGIHTGVCSIGEFGSSYKDFTAIGPVVNLASRLQGIAKIGEIAVTKEVFKEIKNDYPDVCSQKANLKGISEPVTTYIL